MDGQKGLLEETTGFLKGIKEKYEDRKAEKFRAKIKFPIEGNPLMMPKGVIIKTDSIRYQDHDYTYDMVIHVGFFGRRLILTRYHQVAKSDLIFP